QTQKLAVGAQLEVCMQRLPRNLPVLVRCEDDEILARREYNLGKHPLVHALRVVGERPSDEVNRGGTAIVNLNPVGGIAVLIAKSSAVGRQEFGNDNSGRRRISRCWVRGLLLGVGFETKKN